MFQLAAVHELYPFPKFPFFKAVSVRHIEMFVQHLERANAVNTVNGREQIVWIIKVCFVLQECRQIKVVFGKHDAYRLDPPRHELRFLQPLILDFHYLMPLDCLSNLPKAAQDLPVMMRFYVMVFFVCNQFLYRFFVLLRHTVGNQLVQYGEHFIFPHGTALQQDFANSQNFAVA